MSDKIMSKKIISGIILKELNSVDGWNYSSEKNCIEKTFHFKGFNSAMLFCNAVAFLANKYQHHPELYISFNKVTVSCQTHNTDDSSNSLSGKITELDLTIAKEINNILAIGR